MVQNKTTWISITSNQMMRDSMKTFINDLKKLNIEYESYASINRIYIEIKQKLSNEAEKTINEWSYYHPIKILNKRPNLDNCDYARW